jgi:hypothetical protein
LQLFDTRKGWTPVEPGTSPVKLLERLRGGIELAHGLPHRPPPRGAVDRKHGPPRAVLAAQMHEDRVAVVLDAGAVRWVPLFI